MFSFKLRLLYLRYSMNESIGVHLRWSGRNDTSKYHCPCQESNPGIRSDIFTDRAIPDYNLVEVNDSTSFNRHKFGLIFLNFIIVVRLWLILTCDSLQCRTCYMLLFKNEMLCVKGKC